MIQFDIFNIGVIFSSYNTLSLVVEQTKQNPKVHTFTGRLRLLIRICLVRKCLHMPVEILVRPLLQQNAFNMSIRIHESFQYDANYKNLQLCSQTRIPTLATEFYDLKSILGDDILREILLSVLLQCSKLNFKLNLRNATFLDDTWQMPKCVALQLVPCKNLGISVW